MKILSAIEPENGSDQATYIIDKSKKLCYNRFMSFCKFSPSYQTSNKTVLDNVFISEYLPSAPDLCVKAYILGLYKCNSGQDEDNSLEYFCKILNLEQDDVISLFKYWEEKGLVQVLSTDPIEVRYLPVISNGQAIKKFKTDKYTDFNIQLQELFPDRMITQNEYSEYYYLIENKHIEQSALIEIVRYCINYKAKIIPKYPITVAKDWIREGILSKEAVLKKIEELGIADDNLSLILMAMGSKRKIEIEDKDLLNKWMNSYGFELNTIIFVVKNLKSKKRRTDMQVLDEYLTKYFQMKLTSIGEIENYEAEKENLYFTAIAVNKELGIYYEDLTKEIDTYIVSWINMGYDVDILKMIANNCFLSSIKTLEGMNNIISKLFKLGIVSTSSYMQYLNDNLAQDEKIKKVLDCLKLNRNVNNSDRQFYKVWTDDWKFGDEIILYGASISAGANNAIQYLNKILSNWNALGYKTIDQAKADKAMKSDGAKQNSGFIHNNYTKEQIASFLTNLDEVEV